MRVVMTGLDYRSARATEQMMISAYTLDALDNSRREISRKNVNGFLDQSYRTIELMQGTATNQTLNMLDSLRTMIGR